MGKSSNSQTPKALTLKERFCDKNFILYLAALILNIKNAVFTIFHKSACKKQFCFGRTKNFEVLVVSVLNKYDLRLVLAKHNYFKPK